MENEEVPISEEFVFYEVKKQGRKRPRLEKIKYEDLPQEVQEFIKDNRICISMLIKHQGKVYYAEQNLIDDHQQENQ